MFQRVFRNIPRLFNSDGSQQIPNELISNPVSTQFDIEQNGWASIEWVPHQTSQTLTGAGSVQIVQPATSLKFQNTIYSISAQGQVTNDIDMFWYLQGPNASQTFTWMEIQNIGPNFSVAPIAVRWAGTQEYVNSHPLRGLVVPPGWALEVHWTAGGGGGDNCDFQHMIIRQPHGFQPPRV